MRIMNNKLNTFKSLEKETGLLPDFMRYECRFTKVLNGHDAHYERYILGKETGLFTRPHAAVRMSGIQQILDECSLS